MDSDVVSHLYRVEDRSICLFEYDFRINGLKKNGYRLKVVVNVPYGFLFSASNFSLSFVTLF